MADAQKNDPKPWRKPQWVIPPKANAAFVAAMEDVVEVHHRPPDPARPGVCVDEASQPLVGEVRPPRPVRPGRPAREAAAYERHGAANLFMAFEPLGGRRVGEVTERRTAVDFARFLERLLDESYPDAERVVLVTDTRNTPSAAALSEAVEPAEARRLAVRIEWHDTPRHGRWLNMAACELSVLARQCLDRRIPDRAALAAEVATWTDARNAAGVEAAWQFTTADARVKLHTLYPSVELQ